MATVPPTTAQIDTWVDGQPALAQLIQNATQQPGTPILAVICAWTQNDTTAQFRHIPRPDQNAESADFVRGLVATYGAVTLRAYSFTWTQPTAASIASNAAVQSALNNPANWLVA